MQAWLPEKMSEITMTFINRSDAGLRLARKLMKYADDENLLVLALPRGGVPVAAEIARSLHAELDVLAVRKLGVPWHRELAAGAIASGGAIILNEDVLQASGVDEAALQPIIEAERKELTRREIIFRGERPPIQVTNRHVIVVDDGLATGATMEAALTALRSLKPGRVTVAVPVAAPDSLSRIRKLADEIVCLLLPDNLFAVGQWYDDFRQVEDEEVQRLLIESLHTQKQNSP
jgi:putative phosphoribosyl transferase